MVTATRGVAGWLEDAFEWFLAAGDLSLAQELYQVIGEFETGRLDMLLSLLQEAQAERAQSMVGAQ